MKTQARRRADQFGDDYTLVTDSQDVEEIMTNYVKAQSFDNYASLFVKVGDGEYLEVWGSESGMPYVYSTFYNLEIV